MEDDLNFSLEKLKWQPKKMGDNPQKWKTNQSSGRALEHWKDAENGKAESHMLEHQAVAHRGEEATPEFHFKVVKKCQSSLERQAREAIRIQMFLIKEGCITDAS